MSVACGSVPVASCNDRLAPMATIRRDAEMAPSYEAIHMIRKGQACANAPGGNGIHAVHSAVNGCTTPQSCAPLTALPRWRLTVASAAPSIGNLAFTLFATKLSQDTSNAEPVSQQHDVTFSSFGHWWTPMWNARIGLCLGQVCRLAEPYELGGLACWYQPAFGSDGNRFCTAHYRNGVPDVDRGLMFPD